MEILGEIAAKALVEAATKVVIAGANKARVALQKMTKEKSNTSKENTSNNTLNIATAKNSGRL